MNLGARLSIWLIATSLLLPSLGLANPTPNEVFQQADNIYKQIMALREHEKIDVTPNHPSLQTDKRPVHVYAKAIELNDKVIQLQSKYDITGATPKTIPLKEITVSEVLKLVKELNLEVSKVIQAKGVDFSPATTANNKTPANSYEKLMAASMAMDGLIEPIDPNQVFRNSQIINGEIDLIAKAMQVEFVDRAIPLDKKATPYDSTIQGFMNLYKLAKLQRKLGMPAVRVADFPSEKITPTQVYDMTNNILAELVRIKVKLGMTDPAPNPRLMQGKQPYEVNQLMVQVGRKIDALAE